MRKNKIFLSLLIFAGSVLGAASGYFTSEIFKEEYHNNAHYVCAVEPEIQGVYAHKFYSPTDQYYSTQKSYSMNILGDIQSVWDNYKGAGTTIAVIDDGFDHDHSEYTRADGTSALLSTSRYYYSSGNSAYYKSYSSDPTCLDEDWDTEYSEWATHGTNTSTTAAAPAGNGGIVGIAPEANILALKIDMSFVAIKAAMQYAIDQGVDVINMSLGAYAESFTDGFNERQSGTSSTATYLNAVCNTAYNNGIIVVAAAGNEATSHKSYPACNNHVIGVGALAKNKSGELAAFTNFNTSTTQGDEKNVDILAPGFVYAAGITGTSSSKHSQTWHATQGTSFSSPIVAGAACLWKQKNPNGTPAQFEQELTQSAAGIGTYEDAKVNPATYYGNNNYQNNLDANLACGRLDIGSLMTFTNDVSSIDISQTSANLYISTAASQMPKSVQISANVNPSNAEDKQINWSVNNSVVSLSKSTTTSGESITVTAGNSTGTSVVTATSNDGGYTATCTVTVSSYTPVTSFTLKDSNGNTSGTVMKNRTIQLVPDISPSNATVKDVLYESRNESVAIVNDSGLITARGIGETDIYAVCGNEGLESTYHVAVEAGAGTGTFTINLYDASTLNNTSSNTCWSLNDLNGRVAVNGEVNNSVVTNLSQTNGYKRSGGCSLGSNSNTGYIEFTISDDFPIDSITLIGAKTKDSSAISLSVLNTTKSGSGSLNNIGTTLENCANSIIYENLGGANKFKFSASSGSKPVIYTIDCEYAVATPVAVTGVSLNKESITLNLNGTTSETLTANVTPSGATNKKVNWSSSVPSVATVSNGVVTAVSVGTTVITATTVDGSFTDTCEVTVVDTSPIVTDVEITGAVEGQEIEQGAVLQLGATVIGDYDPAQTVTWKSSVTSRATVSASGLVKAGTSASALGTVAITATSTVDTSKSATINLKVIEGSGSGGDVGDYYAPITDSMTGSTLLSNLHSLNSNKQTSRVGYNSMGTSVSSSSFKYTDYDPSTVQIDSQGRKYGTKVLSFYSGTPTTSFNREHTWPNSRGGNLVEADIHMVRPTLASENGSRGNSFFVEGKCSSSGGWDPKMESFGEETYRGDAARIILYSAIADTSLTLVDKEDDSTGNKTMGKLSDLLRWNLIYPVQEREMNRNEGAQSLQGNRNPFIDHPEYACKIWGNTNDATRSICGGSTTTKTLTNLSSSGSPTKKSYTEGEAFNPSGLTVTATYSDGTTANVTNNIIWTPSVLTIGDTQVVGSYSFGGVTKTITITGLSVAASTGGDTPVSGDGNIVSAGELQTGFTLNNTSQKIGSSGYLGIYGGNYIKSATFSPKTGSDITVSYDIGTYGGYSNSTKDKQVLTVGAYVSGSLVSTTAQIKPSGKNTTAGQDVGTATITLNSGASTSAFDPKSSTANVELRIVSASTSSKDVCTRLYNVGYAYEQDSGDVPPTPEITLDSLIKSGTLTKTEYADGEYFDPSGLTFTAHYSDESEKTVSGTEDISWSPSPLVAGTASVTGTYTDDKGTATIVITGLTVSAATIAVSSISISPTSKTMAVGETFEDFVVTFNPVDATNQNVTWSSDNSSVATVDLNGKVTAVSNGSAVITATTEDGGHTATCAITVQSSVSPEPDKTIDHVELSAPSKVTFACVAGISYKVDATMTAYYTDGTNGTISPTSESLTVNPKVLGEKVISAMYQTNANKASATVKVTNFGSSAYVGISASGSGFNTKDSFNATPTEQAEAWATYFIKLTGGSTYDGPCKLPEGQRAAALQDVWGEVKDEYGWMVAASKDVFCTRTNTGLLAEAYEHYRHICVTYGLEQFVTNGSNEKPNLNSARLTLYETIDSSSITLAIICLAGLLTIGFYFVYKRRKEN